MLPLLPIPETLEAVVLTGSDYSVLSFRSPDIIQIVATNITAPCDPLLWPSMVNTATLSYQIMQLLW